MSSRIPASSTPPDSPSRSWSDEALIEACLRGDQLAWSALVEKYKNLVYSAPVKYRMSPEDAADIFQAVWLELHKEMDRLRSPGALRAWLITVAANKCYQWKRKRQQQVESAVAEFPPDPPDRRPLFPELQQEMEREQILRDGILRLPERCRRVVGLLFYSQPPLPYSEVARQLGLAEGSIGFIRGRCLKKLRRILEEMNF